MKNFILATLMLTLVGCYKLNGKLDVTDHLTYKKGNKERVLLIGEYDSSMTFRGEKKITLRASNIFEKVKLTLKLPKNLKRYEEGEQLFSYSAEDLDQLFGIEGKVSTELKQGELVKTTESCPINTVHTECRWNFYDGHYRSGPYTFCQNLPVGTRNVSYRMNTYTRKANIDLVQEGKDKANFIATKSIVKKEYESVGICRHY